jgi:sugar transferase EpsL
MPRVLDVIGAAVLAVLALPVMLVVAVVIWGSDGRPILFVHDRVGRKEQPFQLVKFRTMTEPTHSAGQLSPDDERVTRVGRTLRTLSLDELPELWNVLVGDMALVGPRPLPTRYLARYHESERRRHEVRPGLTGWAQVNGRNALGWDDRFALDVWYVDHRSFVLDLRILVRTVGVVLGGRGIGGNGVMTMTELRPHLTEDLGSISKAP